jgi:hypothetical protein
MFIMRDRADRHTRLAVARVEALISLVQELMRNLESPGRRHRALQSGSADDLAHSIFPVNERPEDPGGSSQDEDGRTAGQESAADDDRLAARDADDITDDEEPARFRLARALELSGLVSQPRYPSLILPGLDFSRIAPALSAITSKAAIGQRIVPELNFRRLLPQVDYTSFLPKIDLLPAMAPNFYSSEVPVSVGTAAI